MFIVIQYSCTNDKRGLNKLTDKTQPKSVTLTFQGKNLDAKTGQTIKSVLSENNLSPHANGSQYFHCPSIGTCGTCALKVEGQVSPMTSIERWRLSFPPHKQENGLRLACQTKILGDTKATRLDGFWGNIK